MTYDDLERAYEHKIGNHLGGRYGIGIYPIVEGCVRWGCVDLDHSKPGAPYSSSDEAHTAAVALQAVLEAFSITSWIERTRTNGRHVWVFAQEWTRAATMRRALLVACSVAEVADNEVNPKQESLAPGQLGNYVRLPYFETERPIITPRRTHVTLEAFLRSASANKTPLGTLERVAGLWTPPQSAAVEIHETATLDEALLRRLNGLAWTIWNEGPLEGRDRSTTLYRLACECRESGLDPSEAVAVVEDADARWGRKFTGRADAERRYADLVGKAYA